MPGQVPLRTDYLANIGRSYGQGLSLGQDIRSSQTREEFSRARLDEFYAEQKAREDISQALMGAEGEDFYNKGEQAALGANKPDLAIQFRKGREEQIKQGRATIVGFADVLSKVKAAGGKKLLGALGPDLANKMLGDLGGFDLGKIDWEGIADDQRWTAVPYEGGMFFVDRQGEKAPQYVALPKKKYKEVTISEKGADNVYYVNESDPTDKIPIGKAPLTEGAKPTALMKNIRDIMRNKGVDYSQALEIMMTGKTMSKNEFLMKFFSSVAKTGMFDEDEINKLTNLADTFYEVYAGSSGEGDSLDEILGLK